MEPIKRTYPEMFRPRWAAAILLAGSLSLSLLAAGCGEWNDNPADSGMVVQVVFPPDNGPVTTGLTGPTVGDPVLSLVVGALVITHTDIPYQNADQIDDTARKDLEDDALQSARYFEVVQLPTSSDTVSFRIPPDGSGNWQLVAVGLRHSIATLDEIQKDSPIWYGFSREFLNDKVQPGDTVTLSMEPACNVDKPPGSPPCP